MIGIKVELIEKLEGVKKSAQIVEVVSGLMPKLAKMLETEVARRTPVLTGNLASSIEGHQTSALEAEVGTNVKYAPYVEFGTASQEPRAMFRKGAEAFKDSGLEMIRSELSKNNLQ
jgi:HK97 gp10 family phage protein